MGKIYKRGIAYSGSSPYDDSELRGRIGNMETALDGHTVGKSVPSDAVFTDTVYDDGELQGKIGDLTSLGTTEKSSIVGAVNELKTTVDGLGEPFRLQDFNQQINVEIPSITTDVANTSIPNVDIDLNVIDPSGALNESFAIAGLVKYEVYDATSGGNRLNVTPICSFSMNSQRVLRARMMCAGSASKTARRIQGAILLKHR